MIGFKGIQAKNICRLESEMVTAQRIKKKGAFDVSLEFPGKVSSLSQHVSQSGMLCRTSKKIKELTVLDIRLELPTKEVSDSQPQWVMCSGVVVHCEKKDEELSKLPYELTIFFDRISERDRNLLAKVIESNTISHP